MSDTYVHHWKTEPRPTLYQKSKPKKLDPNVIRPGDMVKVIDPRFVRRVGYPKCAADFLKEAEATLVEKDILKPHFGGVGAYGLRTSDERKRDERDLIYKFALLLLARNGWGGKERSLHMTPCMEYANKELHVEAKTVVKTGTYVAPTYWRSRGWDGDDYDFESGGLNDCKTHILLRVTAPDSIYPSFTGIDHFPAMKHWGIWGTSALVIPASHVVKLPNERAAD